MRLWSVADLRAFLCGCWRIDRSVLDRRHSISGTFEGRAEFTPDGTGLLYRERGTLCFGAHQGPAEQRYRYEFDDTRARATVRFRGGGLFHELDLSNGHMAVAHACEPDRYEGRFSATCPSEWTSAWTVTGPRKEQTIISVYKRY